MAVLVVSDYGVDVALMRRELERCAGAVEVRVWPAIGPSDEIDAIFIDTPMSTKGGYGRFSNLRWVGFLGHGAGDVLREPTLGPDILVTRLKDTGIALGLTGYVVQAVTAHQLKVRDYAKLQLLSSWHRLELPAATSQRVAVLGLGFIGVRVAMALRDLGFNVCGWSTTAKSIAGVECVYGEEALPSTLADSDYVVAVLPETKRTIGLFGRHMFAAMKDGGFFCNVGRGSLVIESDLIEALDVGKLSGAQLDVFSVEPLPKESQLWRHPKIIVTPHTGGASSGHSYAADIARNYQRLLAGQPLDGLVDRAKGY